MAVIGHRPEASDNWVWVPASPVCVRSLSCSHLSDGPDWGCICTHYCTPHTKYGFRSGKLSNQLLIQHFLHVCILYQRLGHSSHSTVVAVTLLSIYSLFEEKRTKCLLGNKSFWQKPDEGDNFQQRAAHSLMVQKGIDKRKEEDLIKGNNWDGSAPCQHFYFSLQWCR